MTWTTLAKGSFASYPREVEGRVRVVAGIKDIVAFMKEPDGERCIIVTNVAGGSAVSTIIRRASAIVSTIGGPNSHIVIVARDYQVPCIVGAALELSRLESGMRMQLLADGSVQVCAPAGANDGGEPSAEESSAEAPAAHDLSVEELRLLRKIVFAGAVSRLSDLPGGAANDARSLDVLTTRSLVQTDAVIAPTELGLQSLEAAYSRERAGFDAPARDRLHAEFKPLDGVLKSTVSGWQQADARDDWDARLESIQALQVLHGKAADYLTRHAERLPRLLDYRDRLARALEQALDGDSRSVAAVDADSYHTVWFQLHEDLLRLLQKSRDPD